MSSLTLVTLPIGNKLDITLRALEILKTAEHFYAEDTRVFKQLLASLEIDYSAKAIDSFHDYSEGKVSKIIEKIKNGIAVYLVSDAGSPMISDPAFLLLKNIKEEGILIQTIPGVTSVVTALELAALPPIPFHFWGFINRTKGERKNFFNLLSNIFGTHIFFESPHRIFETIDSFLEVFPEEELTITKELTKKFESVYRINKQNYQAMKEMIVDKGEFVFLFHLGKKQLVANHDLSLLVQEFLDGKGGNKKLAKIFSKILDIDSKIIYDQLSSF